MAKISSPRLNIIDKVSRTVAAEFRRNFGEIERLQVRSGDPLGLANQTAEKIGTRILQLLSEAYPADTIYLSTDGGAPSQEGDSPFTWYIEPVGGRTNFAHGMERCYIMFSLLRGNEPVEAAMYLPLSDEMVVCQQGGGAFGKIRLRVTGRTDLPSALITFDPGTEDALTQNMLIPAMSHLLRNDTPLRVSCASGLDLYDLGAARVDAFVGAGIGTAEIIFAKLAVKEAGGMVTDLRGKEITTESTSLLAANSKLHGKILKMLATHRDK